MHLAQARLDQGDLDAALTAAQEAVPVCRALTSRRPLRLVRDFDRHLTRTHGTERRVRHWRDWLTSELRAG